MHLLKCLPLYIYLGASSVQAQETLGWPARLEVWRHERLQATRMDASNQLAAFTTDGCSGGMSSAWQTVAAMFPEFAETHQAHPPWESCCIVHDRAYHLGGPDPDPVFSYQARLSADEALKTCVISTAQTRNQELQAQYGLSEQQVTWAYDRIADAMYDAVRLGGAPCSGLYWRWGYGWPQCW